MKYLVLLISLISSTTFAKVELQLERIQGTLVAAVNIKNNRVNSSSKLYLISSNQWIKEGSELMSIDTIASFTVVSANSSIYLNIEPKKTNIMAVLDVNGDGLFDQEDEIAIITLTRLSENTEVEKDFAQTTPTERNRFNIYLNGDWGSYLDGRPRGEAYCFLTADPLSDPITRVPTLVCKKTKAS